MTFSDYLNECMIRIDCSARELAQASGLSQALISRYRSGERIPALGSIQLARIISGIEKLSEAKYQTPITESELNRQFFEILKDEPASVSLSADSLNALLSSMDINIKKLARAISYDPSYISRIRSGQRKPSNPIAFAEGVIQYLISSCDNQRLTSAAARLMGTDPDNIRDEETLAAALRSLLILHYESAPDVNGRHEDSAAAAAGFIMKLSEFNLDEYIRAIHFDTLHIPTAPVRFPTSKACFGIEEMKQCELDFFRQSVLSRSKEAIYMCGDMDMEDMAQDVEFAKKWMFAIAYAIKKGLRLNIIHTLDRPISEMMLGLESWIPLYMTGQVSSWYLPGSRDRVYSHLHYVSGAAALTGECIRGHHDTCRYYLTNNKKEVAFYRSYCSQLFGKAKPLMAIFTKENSSRYTAFLTSSSFIAGTRRLILSAPPLACMTQELLGKILRRCNDPALADQIRHTAEAERRLMCPVMEREHFEIRLCCLSREQFDRHPPALSLSGAFLDKNLYYTWEEYQEHMELTRSFFGRYPLSSLEITDSPGFNNIRIYMLKGKWAMVSKNIAPAIHFVIRHPKLRAAIEKLELPVVE